MALGEPIAETDGRYAVDVAVLGGVAVLLVALHFLAPAPLRSRLAFDYVAFDPLTLLTSAYVHGTDAHLFGNLLGYGIGAVYAYGVCVRSDRRAWFRRTVVLLLLVLPVAVNLVSYVALTAQFPDVRPVSRGFSGVVAGFGGFLLVALYATVRDRDGVRTAAGVLIAVCFVGVVAVAAGRGSLGATTVALAVAGVSFALFGAGVRPTADLGGRLRERHRDVAEVLLVALVVALLLRTLFPTASLGGRGPLADENVFAHAAGLLFGAVLSVVAARR